MTLHTKRVRPNGCRSTEERNMGGPANSNPGPGEYGATQTGVSAAKARVPFGNAARIGGELNSETPGPGSYDVMSEAIHGQGQGSLGGSARIMDTHLQPVQVLVLMHRHRH